MMLEKFKSHVSGFAASQRTGEQLRANFALGLAGEAGEVADLIKKELFHGTPVDKNKLVKELGDVLWYLFAMCELFGLEVEDVMQANIDKLTKRHGGTSFNLEEAKKNKALEEELLPNTPVSEIARGSKWGRGKRDNGRSTTIWKATANFRCSLSGKLIRVGDLYTKGGYPYRGHKGINNAFHREVIPFTVLYEYDPVNV